MHHTRSLSLLALALFTACGDDDGGNALLPDDGSGDLDAGDVGLDDVAPDGSEDAGADVAVDAAPDVAADTALDAPAEVVEDVGVDTVSDVVADVEPDVGPVDNAVPINFVPDELTVDAAFDYGVQSGAMREDGFMAWTHITATEPVELRVWRDSTVPGEVLLAYSEVVEPADAGFVHVQVDGLGGGLVYRYAFFRLLGDDPVTRSPIGRVRTALPAGSTEPLLVAATSCTKFSNQPYEAIGAMADEEPDLFLHLGDQSYNDDEESVADYRDAWRRTLTDPGYLAIHAATGSYNTWDDHEVTNNWNPESISADRLGAATSTFFESLPIEYDDQNRFWRSYRWGNTAEFFILDCRGERQPSTRGEEDIYVSVAQMDWLKASLAASPAHFKVVLNSVPITDMPTLYVGDDDRWEGYSRQRSELVNHITARNIRNVWFLSGDFHIGFVSRINNSGDARRIIEIAVGPGGNSNPAASLLQTLETAAGVDQFLFNTTSAQSEVATMLEFDPASDSVHVRFYLADGEVIYDAVLQEGD
jgi:alkaline phosphatase D